MKERIATLYKNGLEGRSPSITIGGILKAIAEKWITIEDAISIVGDEQMVDVVRSAKLKEISKVCNAAIIAGVDVETSTGVVHFNLSLEDQSNINNLFRVVELGGTEFPYQSDDGSCRIYTASEIIKIYLTAQSLITTQLTYHNALKAYISSLSNAEEISEAVYGMELPEPYNSEMMSKLAVAQTQMDAIITKLGG